MHKADQFKKKKIQYTEDGMLENVSHGTTKKYMLSHKLTLI